MFPTENLFIEGPDCSGKTTLIRKIHELTNYKWHIHDRSQISRNIFARMYERNLRFSKEDLHMEISNLNNRFIFMLPSFSVIEKRFLSRGDEIHKSVADIREVYDAFSSWYGKLRGLPNIMPCLDIATEMQCDALVTNLDIIEKLSLHDISDQVFRTVQALGNESYPLQFTVYDDGSFDEARPASMKHKSEAEYYEKIYNSLHEKINNELRGKNEYARSEDFMSRRFIYTSDSCISFIQFAIRDRIMDFNVVIRSSDVKNIFPYDLEFLYYLCSTCYNRFNDTCSKARLRFNLNSAHIIR